MGTGVWLISMHEDRFVERPFCSEGAGPQRRGWVICATGGRSPSLLRALRRAGYAGYAGISEGMLGSRRGAGWLAEGLPIVPLDAALTSLPAEIA